MQVQSDAISRTIFEVTDSFILVLDREGRIQSVNPACEKGTGYSNDDLRGRLVFNTLIPENERAQVRGQWDQLWNDGGDWNGRTRLVTRDGDERCVAWSVAVTRDPDDEDYAVAIGIDVTRERELEQDVIRASEDERRRIGRELHDSVASDLIAAAISIENLHRRVDQSLSDTPDVLSRLKNIEESVRQAAQQTRSLSHLLASGQIAPGDFGAALEELAQTREDLSDVEIQLEVPEEGLPAVLEASAAEHLYRIVQEAVHNAIKHAEPNRIEIGVGLSSPTGGTPAGMLEGDGAPAQAADDRLLLRVADDGSGIPSSIWDHIRDDGTTDEDLGQDDATQVGIGLHLMKYRADLIGADLSIESAPGGGTVVQCQLPLPALQPVG